MNFRSLGIGLVALSVTAVGTAAYLVRKPAAAIVTPAASTAPASEAAAPAPIATVAAAPTATVSEPEKANHPAARPVNSTTVAVAKTTSERSARAVKPAMPEPPAEPRVESRAPVASATGVANASDPPTGNDAKAAPAGVPAPPELPKPRYEEVTVTADAVLGVTMDSTVSSETARVEDRVNARISRDVLVDGKVAVPAGSRLEGVVTDVVRGGKFKERPRVGVTFQHLILADGTKIALNTDTVFRDGDAPQNVNAKVGGSGVVGAILGAMIGGKKGAVLGGAAGAAGGAAVVAAGDRAEVVLMSGSSLTVRLKTPITVLVERHL